MLKIIFCLIFAILWSIFQYWIIKVIMTKVLDSTVRYEIIIYLLPLNLAAFMCGAFLGLINS
jgi:hypothetical protein